MSHPDRRTLAPTRRTRPTRGGGSRPRDRVVGKGDSGRLARRLLAKITQLAGFGLADGTDPILRRSRPATGDA